MRNATQIAEEAWIAYTNGAGGVNYLGKPLPQWSELGDDTQAAHLKIAELYLDGTMPPNVSAEELFENYRDLRGGKTYDGKDTPHWSGLTEGPISGWKAVAKFYNEGPR